VADVVAAPSRRQQLAPLGQRLREVRDGIERINDPFDADLGAIHARLAVLVNDVRSLSTPGPVPATAGGYLRLCREAARLSIDDVAAAIATEPAIPHIERASWLRQIEDEVGETTIALSTVAALRRAYPFDVETLVALADDVAQAGRAA
jgi:hypothetical protein